MSACPMATRGMVNGRLLELNLFFRQEWEEALLGHVCAVPVHEILYFYNLAQLGFTHIYTYVF